MWNLIRTCFFLEYYPLFDIRTSATPPRRLAVLSRSVNLPCPAGHHALPAGQPGSDVDPPGWSACLIRVGVLSYWDGGGAGLYDKDRSVISEVSGSCINASKTQ